MTEITHVFITIMSLVVVSLIISLAGSALGSAPSCQSLEGVPGPCGPGFDQCGAWGPRPVDCRPLLCCACIVAYFIPVFVFVAGPAFGNTAPQYHVRDLRYASVDSKRMSFSRARTPLRMRPMD